MKTLMIVAAVMAVGACNRGGNNAAGANSAGNDAGKAAPTANPDNAAIPAANNSAAAAPATAVAGAPQGFPDQRPLARAIDCLSFLTISRQANARPGGFDDVAMNQAQDQWATSATMGTATTRADVERAVAMAVSARSAMPTGQLNAASAWCVQNAPEPDPEG